MFEIKKIKGLIKTYATCYNRKPFGRNLSNMNILIKEITLHLKELCSRQTIGNLPNHVMFGLIHFLLF